MTGPANDALHVWLEKILQDVKEIREVKDAYARRYAFLKKNVESFYDYIE